MKVSYGIEDPIALMFSPENCVFPGGIFFELDVYNLGFCGFFFFFWQISE
jgi:hypothetical protein